MPVRGMDGGTRIFRVVVAGYEWCINYRRKRFGPLYRDGAAYTSTLGPFSGRPFVSCGHRKKMDQQMEDMKRILEQKAGTEAKLVNRDP